MSYVITPAPHPAVLIADSSDLFPVHRIYCVGRNYAAHAREMGGNPERESPFFFCKPADAIIPAAAGETVTLAYPPETNNYHHEIELVVAIGKAGKNIPEKCVHDYIWGYAVGLDMTRRDLHTALREKGQPWELAKAFDQSAPIGRLTPVQRIGHPQAGSIWLKVNGELRQTGRIEHMIWSITETISHLSRYFELRPGDLIFTGTPAGVGAVAPGDLLHGGIDGLSDLKVQVK